ncbi:hypothetical protein K493DRAFT_301931 [Basidiobolus meristosporus CBS 931.73]|uniref:SCP domain-containing protein n=1 Tax=Basidiobolus meristosporus CBS 931.73 TaxID=1314790 RepID=A0A1Y1YAL4_9FUNG|nr:hypothetical protein K493DRAFT_301931 [Basidiobolus meristosporus CBS 931.73]|eukprot:ORX94654.1 hypothetical protein K493DRAFT_301931 [Basidiobolus meristosporus CBS 931.73]
MLWVSLVSLVDAISSRRLICLVNRERVGRGLNPLILSRDLDDVCQQHSVMQARYRRMTHDRVDHASMPRTMSDKGMRWEQYGENVARGQISEEQVMYSWMHSAVHRANILKPSFTHMGSGYDSRGHYWTQGFARVRGMINFSNVPVCP